MCNVNIEYSDCYIAFMDILGFKDLVGRKTCKEIAEIYSNMSRWQVLFKGIEINGNEQYVPVVPSEKITIKVMSDSIVIFVDSNVEDALYALLAMCLSFQSRMLGLTEPVLLRGAIVRGKIVDYSGVLYGPGLVDAYLMEEKNAKFPRIVLNGNTWKGNEKWGNEPIFCFRDFDGFYTIDCFSLFEWFNRENDRRYTDIKMYIENALMMETDNSIRDKYLYLESKFSHLGI